MIHGLVIHVDVDSFYAAAYGATRPELKGKAVAVTQFNSGGFVAVNQEAKRWGIRKGDGIGIGGHKALSWYANRPDATMASVRVRCPDLVVLPMDTALFRSVSLRLLRVIEATAQAWSPSGIGSSSRCIVEKASIDDFYVWLPDAVAPAWASRRDAAAAASPSSCDTSPEELMKASACAPAESTLSITKSAAGAVHATALLLQATGADSPSEPLVASLVSAQQFLSAAGTSPACVCGSSSMSADVSHPVSSALAASRSKQPSSFALDAAEATLAAAAVNMMAAIRAAIAAAFPGMTVGCAAARSKLLAKLCSPRAKPDGAAILLASDLRSTQALLDSTPLQSVPGLKAQLGDAVAAQLAQWRTGRRREATAGAAAGSGAGDAESAGASASAAAASPTADGSMLTLGMLRDVPPAVLQAWVPSAKQGAWLRGACLGHDPSPVTAYTPPQQIISERSFPPLKTWGQLRQWIQTLGQQLLTRLVDESREQARLPVRLLVQARIGYHSYGKAGASSAAGSSGTGAGAGSTGSGFVGDAAAGAGAGGPAGASASRSGPVRPPLLSHLKHAGSELESKAPASLIDRTVAVASAGSAASALAAAVSSSSGVTLQQAQAAGAALSELCAAAERLLRELPLPGFGLLAPGADHGSSGKGSRKPGASSSSPALAHIDDAAPCPPVTKLVLGAGYPQVVELSVAASGSAAATGGVRTLESFVRRLGGGGTGAHAGSSSGSSAPRPQAAGAASSASGAPHREGPGSDSADSSVGPALKRRRPGVLVAVGPLHRHEHADAGLRPGLGELRSIAGAPHAKRCPPVMRHGSGGVDSSEGTEDRPLAASVPGRVPGVAFASASKLECEPPAEVEDEDDDVIVLDCDDDSEYHDGGGGAASTHCASGSADDSAAGSLHGAAAYAAVAGSDTALGGAAASSPAVCAANASATSSGPHQQDGATGSFSAAVCFDGTFNPSATGGDEDADGWVDAGPDLGVGLHPAVAALYGSQPGAGAASDLK